MKQISLLFIIVCLAGCFGATPEKNGLEGKPLPAFNILLTDSITWFNTNAIPAGKPVALFYFSPFCPYCRAQTEEIIDDINKLKDIQFYFVTTFSYSLMKQYYNKYQLSKYPNITMGVDTGHFVQNYFKPAGLPFMAIYGKDKKLNKSFLGKIYTNQLQKVAEE